MSVDSLLAEVAFVAILIVFNGLFAGAEIAVVSARRSVTGGRRRPQRSRGAAPQGRSGPIPGHGPDRRFAARRNHGLDHRGRRGDRALRAATGLRAAAVAPRPRRAAGRGDRSLQHRLPVARRGGAGAQVPGTALRRDDRHAGCAADRVPRPRERPGLAVLAASSRLVLRPLGLRGGPPNPFHTLDDLKAIVREAEGRTRGLASTRLFAASRSARRC